MDHMAPRQEKRPGQLVLGLGLTLGDVDEAPEGRLFAEPSLPLTVEAAFGEPRLVEREPLRDARRRYTRHHDRRACSAALPDGAR